MVHDRIDALSEIKKKLEWGIWWCKCFSKDFKFWSSPGTWLSVCSYHVNIDKLWWLKIDFKIDRSIDKCGDCLRGGGD